MNNVYNPVSTYRIQFHKGFTFKDAERLVPYLADLGVGSLYASPIFEAVPGSMHGYDVVNPLRINPEIGTLRGLKRLVAKLDQHGIGWVQDIVPNHMAFHPANAWLMDVLEKGAQSVYAKVFDTAFASTFFQGPVMVPFLGSTLEDVIQNGELRLVLREGKAKFQYFDQLYPINEQGQAHVLGQTKGERPSHAGGELLEVINADADQLLQLCLMQHYRLCHWQETDTHINYRRFFTVNSLICLCAQDDGVFALTHGLIKQLTDEGIFKGLRIDHIDGLFDPQKYLDDLRNLVGPEVYIVAEKIVEDGELLPPNWPLQGTSGYDYLALSNRLFTQQTSKPAFDELYQRLVPQTASVEQQIAEKKELIWRSHMQGEVKNLFELFKRLRLAPLSVIRQIGEEQLADSMAYLMVHCPVYRYYGNTLPLLPHEQHALQALFEQVRAHQPTLVGATLLLEKLLLDKPLKASTSYKEKLLYFYQRLMQFSGPLMAKGVEDTLMYTYNRFVAHNEVGDAPEAFGLSKKQFHEAMQSRQQEWPLAMSGTATHDTKRGEDTRARLHALSNMPQQWGEVVDALEKEAEKQGKDHLPDPNDRYFIYQTLLATYSADQDQQEYEHRLRDYLQKALREAKRHSNWVEPNEAYEQRCIDFAVLLMDGKAAYKAIWSTLAEEVAFHGKWSSLAQTALKITAPGVPDIYQGTEGWDLSLVDPDNRRPVDYATRKRALKSLRAKVADLPSLGLLEQGAMAKLYVSRQLLRYRRANADLFAKAEYIPLHVRGRYRRHLLAFARRYKNQWCISVIPLHLAALCREQKCQIEELNWKDTRIDWLPDWPDSYSEVLTGSQGKIERGKIKVSDLFTWGLPLSVLHLEKEERKRAAGILMAVSSLPSAFGIGDLGPQAHAFARQMAQSGQRYWQLLPLNPAGALEHYSPYSAYSAFAGNPLYISPELLASEGLLSTQELREGLLPNQGVVDYPQAEDTKRKLLHQAFGRFASNKRSAIYGDFMRFVQEEKDWLHDFALYLAIKKSQHGKPWYQWPKALRLRQKHSLDAIGEKHKATLLEIKWQQFQFFRQWRRLSEHCHALGVQLFGDLPIYVNYDSVDVWANRQLFQLDKEGQLVGVAGVPPDYFNADGQLWGMPVFNWAAHEQRGYAWWIERIKKNFQLYDVLRLDHFRAFYDYWEVPSGEPTAINGKWKKGPGAGFFQALQDALGELPLIAEDLGDISEGVYALRDQFGLPGMQVLQFAFGADLPHNLHALHHHTRNSVVYTGTHDNNTAVGWYKKELDKEGKKRLQQYIGHKVDVKSIAGEMIRLAYASVANLAMVPIQDVLGLGETARMNTPATVGINWAWRLRSRQLDKPHLAWLQELASFYGR